MNYFSSNFTLGILGGGQLGKMLLQETRKYDIRTAILSLEEDAPSRISCDRFVIGNLMDYTAVYNFGKEVDVLTLEIEHVNLQALEQLEKEGIKVYPDSKTLKIIQNKSLQKHFYLEHNIPTAPFQHYPQRPNIKDIPFSLPFVWKSAKSGYDGYGVSIIRKPEDINVLNQESCIIEKMISFRCEVAVIVSRSKNGECRVYPPVEMVFHPETNQVEYVISPARLEHSLKEKLTKMALRVSEKLQHIGVLAVEMFVTHTGDILVNESAPRPHNSGHLTIEGSYTSQFEQHLRAILGLPLGKTESKLPSVMLNLVGEEGYQGQVYYKNIENVMKIEGVTPHIYGKKTTRAFRKMGHITIVNINLEKALSIAKDIKQQIKVISQ